MENDTMDRENAVVDAHSAPAECCGDTFLFQQRTQTSDGVSLAVWRCGRPPTEQSTQPAVVLIHGNYTNRRFWLSLSGRGLAAALCDAGFDVWIGETRGHGESDGGPGHPHPNYQRWQIEDVVRHDLAAIADAVRSGNSQPQHWIGHSFGGVYTLAALSLGTLERKRVASLIMAGSQVHEGQLWLTNRILNMGVRGTTRLLRRFPAKALRLGSEDEPPGISNETMLWKRTQRWASPGGTDYSQGLAELDMPLLALAGCGDTMDPVSGCEKFIAPVGSTRKTLLTLGKAYGFQRDYGHVDMIVSRPAEQEVWPWITSWLKSVIRAPRKV